MMTIKVIIIAGCVGNIAFEFMQGDYGSLMAWLIVIMNQIQLHRHEKIISFKQKLIELLTERYEYYKQRFESK